MVIIGQPPCEETKPFNPVPETMIIAASGVAWRRIRRGDADGPRR